MSDKDSYGITRLDELRDRQRSAWEGGERLVVEILVADLTLKLTDTELLELIYAEVMLRAERTEDCEVDEYVQRFPQFAESLKRLFSVHVALEAVDQASPALSQAQEHLRRRSSHKSLGVDRSMMTVSAPLETGTRDHQDRLTTKCPPVGPVPVTAKSAELKRWLDSILQQSPHQGDLGLFGDYRIQGILGHGGMGIVLNAWERKLDRPVALKLILPQAALREDAAERFLREARAAAAVLHQRIVPIFAVGEVSGVAFLAMPLLKGQSLGSLLKRTRRLDVPVALRYAREVAEGLAAAHARKLTHRDIKPDNIWLEETEDGSHVRILDFGLARGGSAQAITLDGGLVGTPQYMAPEQATGQEPDPRADLFSLGCVLYEMLAGDRAFQGSTLMAVLSSVANHRPLPLQTIDPAIPADLSNLVERLLEKDPLKRVDSAEKLVSTLRSLEKGASAGVTTLSRSPPDAPAVSQLQSDIAGLDNAPGKLPPAPPGVSRRMQIMFAVPIAAVLLFGLSYSFRPKTKIAAPHPPAREIVSSANPPSAALRVNSFRINHFEKVTEQGALDKGILGQHSFGAHVGDQVTIDVELSHPAYAYLVAFRPDGVMELISPDTEDQPPPLTNRIRYPTRDNLDKRYGLQEGAGLWVFAVAASDQPLPAFRAWADDKPNVWKQFPAQAGSILNHDGSWIETIKPDGKTRAKDETALGAAIPFWKAMQYLKGKSHATFAAGQAIAVQDKK